MGPKGCDHEQNGSPTLEAAFEPSAAKLATFWMSITDVGCGLTRLVDANVHAMGDHAATLQSELKRLDELVFSSIEVMDDLFTLVREDLARRKQQQQQQANVLPVNALDAYLDGVAMLPSPLPTASRAAVQTDRTAAVVTPSPSPMAAHHKPSALQPIKIFDMMRARNNRPPGTKPKLELKSETAANGTAASPGGKKRFRSGVAMDTQDDREAKKREYAHTPSQQYFYDRRPIAVHGVRKGTHTQREYAVEFEGLDEYVWVASRRAPPAARTMIQAYAKSARRKRRHLDLLEAKKAYHTAGIARDDVDAAEVDPNEIYMVEKIVDHRIRYGKKQYFVKWDGYDTDENTWEPATKLREEVRGVVDEYERDLAKAAGRKASATKVGAVSAATVKGTNGSYVNGKTKPVALGRPSNPSALTKSAEIMGGSTLLQRSGKIPKVQFLLSEQHSDDDDSEDIDLLRPPASDENDDDDSDSEDDSGIARTGSLGDKGLLARIAKQRQSKELSPSID